MYRDINQWSLLFCCGSPQLGNIYLVFSNCVWHFSLIFRDWPLVVASFEKDIALNVFTFTLMIIGLALQSFFFFWKGLALLSLYKVSNSFATLIWIGVGKWSLSATFFSHLGLCLYHLWLIINELHNINMLHLGVLVFSIELSTQQS